jgi:hypothetical protein
MLRRADVTFHVLQTECRNTLGERRCPCDRARIDGGCLPQVSKERVLEPSTPTTSGHIMPRLVYCGCGAGMQAIQDEFSSRRSRLPLSHNRCQHVS